MMIEMYFNPELGSHLREHDQRQAELDWAQLIEAVTDLTAAIAAEQAAGTESTDPRMFELARRWRALINHYTDDKQFSGPLSSTPSADGGSESFGLVGRRDLRVQRLRDGAHQQHGRRGQA